MMENNHGIKRKHEEKRLQKETLVEEIRTSLENGIFETYQFDGQSEVWNDFVKLRKSDSKEHVEFVQCILCKGLLSFKEDSGTSHLLRHKCPKSKSDGSGVASKFRSLPYDKIGLTRKFVTSTIIKFCTGSMVSCEAICDSENFLSMAQSFVSLGNKNGNIDLRSVFPSSSQTSRVISKIKTTKEQDICTIFRESMKRRCCSVTIEIQNFENSVRHNTKVAVISIQHFEKELKGLKKIVCFSLPLNSKETQDSFQAKLFKQFNNIGVDKNDLMKFNIVTPNCEIFSNILASPFKRNNCVAEALTKILNDSFKPSSSMNENDTLTNCRDIVKHINSMESCNFNLIERDETWKGEISMLRSLIENSEHISKVWDHEDEDTHLLYNKQKAEEMLSFLEPFVDAIDDLKSTTYTTANKILLWHAVLMDHLANAGKCSLEMQRIVKIAKESFGTRFYPTLENKVDCFLDPRYKALRMLGDAERNSVIDEVRKLLEELEVVPDDLFGDARSNSVPPTKKNRGINFEGNVPKEKGITKKTSRFSRFESNNEEFDKMDEVAIYLKLPAMSSSNLTNEFEVMSKFWNQQKNKLPKMFQLASSRLHVPASCGNVSTKPNQLMQNLKSDALADYLFVGYHFHADSDSIME